MTTKTKTILIYSLKILAVCAALAVAITLLWRYEYFSSLLQIDNPVGMLPVMMMAVLVGATAALSFMPHSRRHAPLSVTLAVMLVLSVALFPNALRGNWWIAPPLDTSGESADISVYEPFKEGNKTAKLGEESTLKLSGDLPVMDGALALYPVYSAFAESVYERQAIKDEIMFTNTLRAFDGIIAGERDVIFSAYASKSQLAAAEKAGAELVFTPIGKEAFVFLVGKSNPTENLTYKQIKDLYSGKTAKWKTLGWEEGGDIVMFRRPEGSGSETGIQSVMKDLPLIAPQPLPDKSLVGTNSLMKQISVEYKGVQPALGYSYKFFAETMYPNPDSKILKVDGVYPSSENIKNGSYRFTANFYAVTNGEPKGNTKALIDWILSEQGQGLIEKCGYAPL